MTEPPVDKDAGDGTRAQTALDFQVGAAIFLIVTIFVLGFTPSLLEPFDDTTQGDTVTTDRLAGQLATDVLTDPSSPYSIDRSTTVTFFDSDEITSIADSLRAGQNLNVSLTGSIGGSTGILCWDTSDRSFKLKSSCSSSDILLADGGNPAKQSSVTTSRRVVSISGHRANLRVRVW